MGNRAGCLTGRGKHAHHGESTTASVNPSIVPDQDPLVRSSVVVRRVVHADINRDFEILPQVLGTGYSGAVRLAEHRTTRQQVAVKQFTKSRLKAHRLELTQSEVEVYLRLDHPNICRLLHAYESKHDVWLVMELCGCELYSRLSQKKVYHERDAADVMKQMLQAVSYLHAHRFVHRDLKLENWMYGVSERDDRVKLIDFGFSRILGCAGETLDMPCGTLHYTSPEVLSRKYTSQCDMWSMGVICYMLLLGRPPFQGASQLKIAKAIVSGQFPRDSRWQSLSSSAREFVEGLLQKDPAVRFDATTALGHPWITGAGSGSLCGRGEIGVDVLKSFRKFAQGSHLRRAALTVMAYSLTSRELQDVEQTFLNFDTAGRGTISIGQLESVMSEHLEVSSQEVQRIFQRFDLSDDEEIHYTPFIAAMLATRVRLHEDKVRSAFEAFDRQGTGFITADSLVTIFDGLSHQDQGQGRLTQVEAEQWIREADYKGNGVIDYDGFLAALMGKKLWALSSFDHVEDNPAVRVFDEGRARGLSDSFTVESSAGSPSSRIRSGLAQAIIDGDEEQNRGQTFPNSMPRVKDQGMVMIRTVSCDVDERYFCQGARVPVN